MSQFTTFGLAPHLLSALQKAGISNPTPVQAESIRPACEGRDVFATAQTGTGKTFAYLLPLLTRIEIDDNRMGLILVPTRELAIQVKSAINQLCSKAHSRAVLLIGGEPMFKQLKVLRTRPTIVVGTPGRIMDHLDRQTLSLSKASFLVLDEVDRMLDMGFSQQLDVIRKALPETVQTLMFSATMPKNIAQLAEQYLTNPHRVAVGSVHEPVINVQQAVVYTKEDEKFDCLVKELDSREGSVIIFVKTKKGADILAKKLKHKLYTAEAIHGDLRQQKRVFIVDKFRKQLSRIMVATDIAARGIDVPHVQHVVNYDLPQSPEDYVHRIGRTGRAGNQGFAISLIVPAENRLWSNIQRFLQGKSYSSNLRIDGFNNQKDGSSDRFGGYRRNKPSFGQKRQFSRPYNNDRFGDRHDNQNNRHNDEYKNYKSDRPRGYFNKDEVSSARPGNFPRKERSSHFKDHQGSGKPYQKQKSNYQSVHKHKISTSI